MSKPAYSSQIPGSLRRFVKPEPPTKEPEQPERQPKELLQRLQVHAYFDKYSDDSSEWRKAAGVVYWILNHMIDRASQIELQTHPTNPFH